MRLLRALGAALIVGGGFALLMVVALGASWLFATLAAGAIALAILAVVLSRTTERDLAADEAWRSAAPDLPPASDRRDLERQPIPVPDRHAGSGVEAGRKAKGAPR